MQEKFKKRILVLRQNLIGRRYFNALSAMEFASRFHTGIRKDKVTPEFDHQVNIALFALTLPDIMFPEELIATIMLHDVREDYNVSDSEIRNIFNDSKFATRVDDSVENMTKTYRGQNKDIEILFDKISKDPIASIAKLCDRIHNLQSMVGVFTIEKQRQYISETENLFFPMLKKARRNFSHQVMAYENCKWMLRNQIQLIEAIHSSS